MLILPDALFVFLAVNLRFSVWCKITTFRNLQAKSELSSVNLSSFSLCQLTKKNAWQKVDLIADVIVIKRFVVLNTWYYSAQRTLRTLFR